MSKQAVGVALRIHSNDIENTQRIERDISFPEFYHEIGEYEGFEMT